MRKRAASFGVAVALVLGDQLSKALVSGFERPWEFGPLIIGRIVNDGGAFGIGIDNRALLLVGLVVVAGLIAVAVRGSNEYAVAGFWLLLGGALSNLFDRLVAGGVIDIVGIRGIVQFNLADVMIVLGGLALLESLLLRRSRRDA